MGNDASSPKTLIEMLMEVIAPIVGGTVLGWLVMIGLVVVIGSVIDTITNRRTKR